MARTRNRDDALWAIKVLVDYEDLWRHCRWSKTKVHTLRMKHGFPKPEQASKGGVRAQWDRGEVDVWRKSGGQTVADTIPEEVPVVAPDPTVPRRGNPDFAAIAAANDLWPINWNALHGEDADIEEVLNHQRFQKLAESLLVGAVVDALDAAVRKLKP